VGRGWGGGLLGLMRGVRSRSFVFRFCHDKGFFCMQVGLLRSARGCVLESTTACIHKD